MSNNKSKSSNSGKSKSSSSSKSKSFGSKSTRGPVGDQSEIRESSASTGTGSTGPRKK